MTAQHGSSDTLPISVLIETTARRAFACALDWPGWARPGRDEDAALAALGAYSVRFAPVAAAAGTALPGGDGRSLEFSVVERREGTATTAFGAPDIRAVLDSRPTDHAAGLALASFAAAAWGVLDRVVASAPAVLRKGPRGGGRDRDPVLAHVVMAEHSYSRVIGLRLPEPDPADPVVIAALRAAIIDVLSAPSDGSPLAGKRWPARFAARRIAWHVLDHAWEIEDRTEA